MANLKNEWAVLGSILVDADYALPIVNRMLTPEDFSDPCCAKALEIWQAAHDEDRPMDAVLLESELTDAGFGLVDTEMREWLTVPTAHNVAEYARRVKDEANKRKLKAVTSIASSDFEGSSWRDLYEEIRSGLDAIETTTSVGVLTSETMIDLLDKHYQAVKENPEASFCRSGYKDLDKVLGGGFQKSGLYIIGARPGMGKTTLALNIADRVAMSGNAVLFVSLEMSRVQIMAKRIAINSRINYSNIMQGSLSPSMYQKYSDGAKELNFVPFYCSDSSALTVAEIAGMARSIEDLKLIVIDYLGLIRSTNESKKLYEQVTEISRDLKALAKRLNIPVLALCQVNRQSVQNKSKKPSLADLRDSGSIEQDADGVILLYRDDYFNMKDEGEEPSGNDEIQLIIAKNRHGEGNATINMRWNGSTGQINELDYKH